MISSPGWFSSSLPLSSISFSPFFTNAGSTHQPQSASEETGWPFMVTAQSPGDSRARNRAPETHVSAANV
jgi:hypothetical protein